MSARQIIESLDGTRRVWAIASVHGEARKLADLHEKLWPHIEPGDRLIYLGNILGHGDDPGQAVDELLAFRRAFMALEPTEAHNVIILRGSQEEMWQKLLQIQFATDPRAVLNWMINNGLGATLESYGTSVEEARHKVSTGTVSLTRWTQELHRNIQSCPGHYDFFGALRRAGIARPKGSDGDSPQGGLLFVNAGLDPQHPLNAQRDNFWWAFNGFARITQAYAGFSKVVRGFDPRHPGAEVTDFTVTLDAGAGQGGPLLAGCFSLDGELIGTLEA